MFFQVKVQKWGNSFGIRVRKVVADHLNVKEGSTINLELYDGKMLVTPACPEYSLDELVAGINADNLHGETSTGRATGGEVW